MKYYVICCLPAVFVFYFGKDNFKKNKKSVFWLLILPMILLAFKGAAVGADTGSYNRMFDTMKAGTFENESSYDRIEIGYKLFLRVITFLFPTAQFQHIVLALFHLFILIYFISKNADRPSLFVIMFLGLNLYSFYMTGIRQSIAMSICLLAYEKVKKKQFFRFLILVLIAISFHKAAMFFIPAYFIAYIKFSKNLVPFYIALLGAIAVFNKRIFLFVGEAFDISYGIEQVYNGYLSFAIMLFITLSSLLMINQLREQDPDNMRLLQLNIVTMALWTLRLFSRTAERPALFYTFFTILLVDKMLLCIKDPKNKAVWNALFPAAGVLMFLYKISSQPTMIPFKWFWQNT